MTEVCDDGTLRSVAISLQTCVVTRATICGADYPGHETSPFRLSRADLTRRGRRTAGRTGTAGRPHSGRRTEFGAHNGIPHGAAAHLIDINGIAELATVTVTDDVLTIGACVRHAAFEADAVPGVTGALLRKVVRNIAHYPIRTRGTFCGSVANADPASEWCCVMAALDGVVLARSQRGHTTSCGRRLLSGRDGDGVGRGRARCGG